MRDDPHVELVDDALLQEAVAERTRDRLLAVVATEDATLASTLRATAEHGTVLVLRTTTGHELRGRVVAVASDHVVVRGDHGTAWLALHGIVSVRPRPGGRTRTSDEPAHAVRPGPPLVEVLRVLHERRLRVQVLVPGGPVGGRLVQVGRDVAAVAADGGGGPTLVATDRVVAVTTEDG